MISLGPDRSGNPSLSVVFPATLSSKAKRCEIFSYLSAEWKAKGWTLLINFKRCDNKVSGHCIRLVFVDIWYSHLIDKYWSLSGYYAVLSCDTCITVLQYWLSSLQRDYNNYDGDIWLILTVLAMLSFILTISVLYSCLTRKASNTLKHTETNEFDYQPPVKSICVSSLALIGSTVICTFITLYI